MHRYRLPLLAAALAALTAPALAGSPFYGDAAAPRVSVTGQDLGPVPTHRMGPFSCSYREQRTKLERKNCGGQRF